MPGGDHIEFCNYAKYISVTDEEIYTRAVKRLISLIALIVRLIL